MGKFESLGQHSGGTSSSSESRSVFGSEILAGIHLPRGEERALTRALKRSADGAGDKESWKADMVRSEQLACLAMSKLSGIPASNISEVLTICLHQPDAEVIRSIREILNDGTVTSARVTRLEKAVSNYEAWMKAAEANPDFVSLATSTIDPLKVRELLRAEGAQYYYYPEPEDHRELPAVYIEALPPGAELGLEYLLQGDHDANETLPNTFERFLDFRTAERVPSKEFLKLVTEIATLPPAFQHRIFSKFCEIAIAAQLEGGRYLGAEPANVRRYLAYGLAFSDAMVSVCDVIAAPVRDLKQVASMDALRIFELVEGGDSLVEVLADILPRLEQSMTSSHPVSAKTVVDLMGKGLQAERYELLDAILDVPELVEIMGKAKKFAAFDELQNVFGYSALKRDNPDLARELLQGIRDAWEANRVAVAQILTQEVRALSKENCFAEVFVAIRQYPKFHVIGSQYFQAVITDDAVRRSVILAALAHTGDGAQLTLLAERLGSLGKESLARAWLDHASDTQQLLSSLLAKKFAGIRGPDVGARPDKMRAVAGRPWLDELVEQFLAGTVPNRIKIDEASVRSAYNTLPVVLRSRIKSVWERYPGIVADLCRDINSFWGTKWFDLMLNDSYLFSRYRNRLTVDPAATRQVLEGYSSRDGGVEFSEIRGWLSDRNAERMPPELRPVQELWNRLPPHILATRFDRVVVCGKIHSQERQDRLRTAGDGIPVAFYDFSDRRGGGKLNGRLAERDLVICLVSDLSPNQFAELKRKGAEVGCQLLSSVHTGIPLLENIVGAIARNSKLIEE